MTDVPPAPIIDLYQKYVLKPRPENKVEWDMHKLQLAHFWRVEEFSGHLDQDVKDWNERLTPEERHFMSLAIAFFVASDGIVADNLVGRFRRESDLAEVCAFYDGQALMEQIHAEAYALILERLVPDDAEKDRLFHAFEHHPCVRRKTEWALRWMRRADDDGGTGPAARLAAFACVEGIFFSSSFATIYWFKSRNLLPGTSLSNEWISRDEGLHTDFAVHRYRRLPRAQQLAPAELYALVDEVVAIELLFVEGSLPERMLGMNAALMGAYVRFVADRLLVQFGLAPAYGGSPTCPLPFMIFQAGLTKSNFFETQVTNYSAAVMDMQDDTYHAGAIDDDDCDF